MENDIYPGATPKERVWLEKRDKKNSILWDKKTECDAEWDKASEEYMMGQCTSSYLSNAIKNARLANEKLDNFIEKYY